MQLFYHIFNVIAYYILESKKGSLHRYGIGLKKSVSFFIKYVIIYLEVIILSSCYTIIGNDNILINKKILEIEKSLGNVNYDKITFNMDETSIITLLEEVQTIPFLEVHKLVIMNRSESFFGKKFDEKLFDSFVNYLKKPLSTTTLIIIVEKDLESKSLVFGELKKNTTICNLLNSTPVSHSDYVKDYVTSQGFSISNRAIDELLLRTDSNMQTITIELEKIMTYNNENKMIELKEVILLVNRNLEDNIYNLIDAVLQKERKKVMDMYNDMMVLNEEETRMVSALLNKFNEMYDIKSLVEKGYSQNDIAALYNIKPGRVYYMMKNANMSTMKDIKRNINALSDLDFNIKSGKIDKKLGLELYLLSI